MRNLFVLLALFFLLAPAVASLAQEPSPTPFPANRPLLPVNPPLATVFPGVPLENRLPLEPEATVQTMILLEGVPAAQVFARALLAGRTPQEARSDARTHAQGLREAQQALLQTMTDLSIEYILVAQTQNVANLITIETAPDSIPVIQRLSGVSAVVRVENPRHDPPVPHPPAANE